MIAIHHMSFGYNQSKRLFEKLSLELQPGNICGLLGKNGAGKTTLLKIIAGLIFPTAGDCTCFGFDAKKRDTHSLENMYFVPEEFFVPSLTAKKYLALYASFYPHFDISLFERCMTEFNVDNDKLLSTLSYGQKKKFLISFALATNAQLIIFDEPTNGLDIPSKSQFRKLIASCMTDEKLFIISTHQVHDVEKLVERLVILDEGKIIVNVPMTKIMQTITVEQETIEPSVTSAIYVEKNISGYSVVTENKSGKESHIDLELFFNMVVANKEKSAKLFCGER